VPLVDDVFCVLTKAGHADAFVAEVGAEEPSLRWLVDINIFEGERVRLLSHLQISDSLLVVFASRDGPNGALYVRVLDVPAILRGQSTLRSCGTLSSITVPLGGFVEADYQNCCIFACTGQHLLCWDAGTFEQRFALGPWTSGMLPNVRFTQGSIGTLELLEQRSAVHICLHSVLNGSQRAQRELNLQPHNAPFVFLELINHHVLLMRGRECCNS